VDREAERFQDVGAVAAFHDDEETVALRDGLYRARNPSVVGVVERPPRVVVCARSSTNCCHRSRDDVHDSSHEYESYSVTWNGGTLVG